MDLEDFIEQEVSRQECEVYGGSMPARSKALLREMLRKEDRFWTYFDCDHINGYDDGEPQTSADYNR